ncbi:MAG: DUF3048 domain-containing protein [Candidatus Peribacteraceae bacterium]|nr:DUF3048 domain-containing protein [Candidatus Peribacteraceae bacterium]MDD5074845.1 DUF3048 domain-containing protein [Candidatus Peribacteraceae bacterium]
MKFAVRSLSIAITVVLGVVLVAACLVFFFVPAPPASHSVKTNRTAAAGSMSSQKDVGSWLLSGLKMVGLSHEKELVAFMVENHEAARPFQEGVRQALLVEEFPVEGFISRFALVFDKNDLPKRIGPMRSLRPYYIDALEPWASTVIHAGGSPEAFAKVENGEISAFNLLFYYDKAERDKEVPEPHNLFIRRDKVLSLLTREVRGTEWPPYDIGTPRTGSAALIVKLNFHNPLHNVVYTYDRLGDAYVRASGDVKNQGAPRNVLIVEMPVSSIGEYGRLTIPVVGRGRAFLFHSGIMQEGYWHKKGLYSPFTFTTAQGDPLLFAPGQTWMTALPGLDRLSWFPVVQPK